MFLNVMNAGNTNHKSYIICVGLTSPARCAEFSKVECLLLSCCVKELIQSNQNKKITVWKRECGCNTLTGDQVLREVESLVRTMEWCGVEWSGVESVAGWLTNWLGIAENVGQESRASYARLNCWLAECINLLLVVFIAWKDDENFHKGCRVRHAFLEECLCCRLRWYPRPAGPRALPWNHGAFNRSCCYSTWGIMITFVGQFRGIRRENGVLRMARGYCWKTRDFLLQQYSIFYDNYCKNKRAMAL